MSIFMTDLTLNVREPTTTTAITIATTINRERFKSTTYERDQRLKLIWQSIKNDIHIFSRWNKISNRRKQIDESLNSKEIFRDQTIIQ